jgi:hypothetical protein
MHQHAGGPRTPQDGPGGSGTPGEAPGGPGKPQEAPGGPGMPQGAQGDVWRRKIYVFLRFPTFWTPRGGPGGPRTPQDAPGRPRRPQEAPGRPRGRLGAQNVLSLTIFAISRNRAYSGKCGQPKGRPGRPQEAPGGPRRPQEAPGSSREAQGAFRGRKTYVFLRFLRFPGIERISVKCGQPKVQVLGYSSFYAWQHKEFVLH